MKSKEDTPTPDSADISDMQTNDDERTESRERARGKRRTAREIASMFEQLKQRHIARKKEWQEEKEELLKRVQTADESKRVLAELKKILENLREELRLEELKRIEMEAEYFAEKRRWETERAELQKNLEESAYESDKGEKDLKRMTEKLAQQSRQLSEWQATVLRLKKESLEIENRFLRDKRELQFELEKERSSWKKREKELLNKIRQMDTKSSTSSASPTHIDTDVVKDFINMEDYAAKSNTTAASSTVDARKYSDFQKTVDDALKQIEKINTDLKENDSPRHESDSFTFQVTSDNSATPSPQLQGRVVTEIKPSSEEHHMVNAPWRTRRRPTASVQSLGDNTLSPEDKFPSITHSDSLVDASICLPLIKPVRKLSPNPERKVRKISGQGSQIDITVSSPDAPSPGAVVTRSRYSPAEDRNASESSSPHDHIAESPLLQSKNPGQHDFFHSKKPSVKKSPILSRQRKVDFIDDNVEWNDSPHTKAHSVKATVEESRETVLAANGDDEASRDCSSSPRLPMLHRQLLFKREPSLPLDKTLHRSFESETLGVADKRKTSDDDLKLKERALISSPKRGVKMHTPYFDPKIGYRTRSRSPKCYADDTTKLPQSSGTHKNVSTRVSPPSVDNKKEDITPPPAVQPKPRVSIHKDKEGNIVKVSPAGEIKSVSPESTNSYEKQNSLGRMGKAGREWIRKKLSFIDRKPDEQQEEQRIQGAPDYPKKKGKTKTRQRSSSSLRNKRGVLRSLSSTEESSDGESRKRDSFLRRHRRKGRSSGGSKSPSPAKSKPKKYTRSKTEGSPNDMRNFLAKFKASQSNPNKPSVVKQFEMKLLENEVKTLSDENLGKPYLRRHETPKSHPAMDSPLRSRGNEAGYVSREEGDEEVNPMAQIPGIGKTSPRTIDDRKLAQNGVKVRSKSQSAPEVMPKTYFRKSMTDFKPSPSSNDHWLAAQGRASNLTSKSKGTDEGFELCENNGVAKLVNRFSANLDDKGLLGVKKPFQEKPTMGPSHKRTNSERVETDSQRFPRSYSLSSRDNDLPLTRYSASARTDTSFVGDIPVNTRNKTSEKPKARGVSWRDRVVVTPETDTSEATSVIGSTASSRGRDFRISQRVSAPPGQLDSLSSFWDSERPTVNYKETPTSSKSGRMKLMSEEMKRKADMLEKALSKGPRKPRRYRRAETQPVHSNFGSSDEDTLSDDTEDVLDVAFRPLLKDFGKRSVSQDGNKADLDSNLAGSSQMHAIIPPVTGKFSKPAKPGRLPSRWARS